jgi:hypothetical protein
VYLYFHWKWKTGETLRLTAGKPERAKASPPFAPVRDPQAHSARTLRRSSVFAMNVIVVMGIASRPGRYPRSWTAGRDPPGERVSQGIQPSECEFFTSFRAFTTFSPCRGCRAVPRRLDAVEPEGRMDAQTSATICSMIRSASVAEAHGIRPCAVCRPARNATLGRSQDPRQRQAAAKAWNSRSSLRF